MRARWSCKGLLAAVALVCFASSANGLGSNKTISQYLRDHWGAEQGFPGGPVYAFAQTPEGYLWIGTEKGLVRFDGVRRTGSLVAAARNDLAPLPKRNIRRCCDVGQNTGYELHSDVRWRKRGHYFCQ